MKKTLVLLAATAAVVLPAAHAQATEQIPPPVIISSTGSCPTGYLEVAQASNTAVCVVRVSPPRFRVTTTGCTSGETAYLILNRYGVCTS